MSENSMTDSNQYLTFTLGDEQFALEIGKVREVLDYTDITKIPRSPAFMRGVINLRGNVVPIIDLRMTLGMTGIKRSVDTCIVIAEVELDGESMHVGALADSVQEVVEIDPAQTSPPPRLGTKLNTDFIQGMGKRGDHFLIILDIDKVLSASDMAMMQRAAEGGASAEASGPEPEPDADRSAEPDADRSARPESTACETRSA